MSDRKPLLRAVIDEPDDDAPLDLQALVAQVHRHGRYDDIDYAVPPVPPLGPADEAWADELLRQAGKRPAAPAG
jgi:hypothetical protein